jgi:hypothetical protein
MSLNTIPAWSETKYSQDVVKQFQSSGFKLSGTYRPPISFTGSKYVWKTSGLLVAQEFKRGHEAKVQNQSRGTIEVEMKTWQVFDEIHKKDLNQMSVNEYDQTVEDGGMAMGRKADEIIMAEVNAGAPAITVPLTSTTNGMTLPLALAIIAQAQRQFKEWNGEVFFPLPAQAWNQMMGYKQFSSADYVTDLPMAKMTDTRFWNGVKWMLMPDELFPVVSGQNIDVFLWHKKALGFATNENMETTTQWDNRKSVTTVNMTMGGVPKTLRSEGMVRARINNDAVIAPN